MKKLNGEYSIDLGKWVNQKFILPTFNPDDMRTAIAEMIPNDFILNEKFSNSSNTFCDIWMQQTKFGCNIIGCKLVSKLHTAISGMCPSYWDCCFAVSYTVVKSSGIDLEESKPLDTICKNIARMVEDKYALKYSVIMRVGCEYGFDQRVEFDYKIDLNKEEFSELNAFLFDQTILFEFTTVCEKAEKRALEVLDEKLGKDVIKYNIWVALGPGNEGLPSKIKREFLMTDVGTDKTKIDNWLIKKRPSTL